MREILRLLRPCPIALVFSGIIVTVASGIIGTAISKQFFSAASRNDPLYSFERLPEAEKIAADILRHAGLKNPIRVYLDTHNRETGLCAYSQPKRRVIVFTQRCSMPPYVDGRYNWQVIQIIGHEIGHILNGHGLNPAKGEQPGTLPWQQTEADEFSGWAMQKLGANLQDATDSLDENQLNRERSIAAIRKGWSRAENLITVG